MLKVDYTPLDSDDEVPFGSAFDYLKNDLARGRWGMILESEGQFIIVIAVETQMYGLVLPSLKMVPVNSPAPHSSPAAQRPTTQPATPAKRAEPAPSNAAHPAPVLVANRTPQLGERELPPKRLMLMRTAMGGNHALADSIAESIRERLRCNGKDDFVVNWVRVKQCMPMLHAMYERTDNKCTRGEIEWVMYNIRHKAWHTMHGAHSVLLMMMEKLGSWGLLQ